MIHPIDQLKLIQPEKKDDSAAQLVSMGVLFAGLYLLLRKPEQAVGESVLEGNPRTAENVKYGYRTDHTKWWPLENHKQEEKGNDFPDISKYPGHEAIWVTHTPEAARRYGDDVRRVNLFGAKKFHEDGDGGYLYIRPVDKKMVGNPTWSDKTSFSKPSLHDLERAIVDLRYAPKAAWSDEIIGALLVIHPTEVKVKLADENIVAKNLNLLGLKHHRDKQLSVFREREKTELIEELKKAYNLNWRISRRGLNKMGSNIAPSHFTDILGRVSSKTIFTILEALGVKEL